MLEIPLTLHSISITIVIVSSLASWLNSRVIKIINYGRLKGSLFPFEFPPRIAWCLMELPNLIAVFYFTAVEGDGLGLGLALFLLHYLNRTIIYPLTLRTTTKIPVEIVASALCFTSANGYLQGISNAKIQGGQAINWVVRSAGLILFFAGMLINIKADRLLQASKSKTPQKKDVQPSQGSPPKTHNYVVIDQFLFKYISSPNYFGEIIEWLGYFLVCQNAEAFLFFFSTLNILVAAALPRHEWNRKNIEGYPLDRKAIVPFLV
jgi:protein-S-isoprenylcysteine O-methyltransferase Ste14